MSNGKSEPLQKRRKSMSAPLSEDLRDEYGFRSISVREGDKVRVTRGDFLGMEGEISEIDTSKQRITVEGVEAAKADETEVPTPIHPSKVEITKLETGDKMREKVIKRRAEGEIEIPEEPEEIEEEEEEIPEEIEEEIAEEEAEEEEPEAKEVEEEEVEEEVTEEIEEDFEDLLEKTIPDIKEDLEEKDVDYEALIEAEKEGKNRKTLIQWLEKRV